MQFNYDHHLRTATEARARYESVSIVDGHDYQMAVRRLEELRGCKPGTWEFMEAGALEDKIIEWEDRNC
jgi:hypothetical protein